MDGANEIARARVGLLEEVEGKKVEACWVHLPMGGGMVEIAMGGER